MKIFKILLLFLFSLSLLSANSLDIYILNPEEDRGNEGLIEIIKSKAKVHNPSILIDSRSGEVVFRGLNEEVKKKLKNIYGGKKEEKNDIPYTLRSIYQLLLPNTYKSVNLYFVNSIFYKDDKFDFKLGIPNDAFLTSSEADFIHLKSFEGLNVHTYILNDKKMFMHSEHQNGIKRFYAILCDKLKLDLQVFNTTFSTKKEKIIVEKVQENSKVKALAIVSRPPKKLHFEEDEVEYLQVGDHVGIKIHNKDRADMKMFVSMNGVSSPVTCDAKGICIFNSPLRLGKNVLTFNKLDGTEYRKEVMSNYLPHDEFECYSLSGSGDNIFILKVMKSYRPENDIVTLRYEEEKKEYNTTVENGFYEFKIPLKYADNTFLLTQYSGEISSCSGENKKIKEENEKKRIAEEKRIAELAEIEREKIEKRQEEELKKKREIAAKKRASTAINHGTNKVTYNNEILIENYNSPSKTQDIYAMDLNKPMKIDEFSLSECDGDNEGDDRNSFDIYLVDEYGTKKQIASTVHASGDDVCKNHSIKNPFPNFMAIRIIVDPIGTLGPIGGNPNGGAWQIKKASIKYVKGQN